MLTLGQAAIETGMAKSAISRAIKSGRLSARKKENGSFEIDPAELFRVYPPASSSNGSEQRQEERTATPNETNGLQREVVVLRELIEEIKGERDNLREERERLLKVIEEQAGTVKQLTNQPELKVGISPTLIKRPSVEVQGTWKHVWVVLAILTTCTAVLVLVWWQGR